MRVKHTHTYALYIVYDIVGKVLKQAIKEDVYTAVTIKHKPAAAVNIIILCLRKNTQHTGYGILQRSFKTSVSPLTLIHTHTCSNTHTHTCSNTHIHTHAYTSLTRPRLRERDLCRRVVGRWMTATVHAATTRI